MRVFNTPVMTGGIVVAAMALLGGEIPRAREGACDAACLRGVAESYFTALLAHDSAAVGVASQVKYTEDTKPMRLGSGLWKTVSGSATKFAVCVPDPVAGQVGCLRTLNESGNPVLLAVRLKVEARRITEIEHIVARSLAGPQLANLVAPRPGLLAAVSAAERTSRDGMLHAVTSYYDAIVKSDGGAAPFADDCVRRENGAQTTLSHAPLQPGASERRDAQAILFSLGCRDQINSRALSYIAAIDARRVEIADPETGLVFALAMFRRPMRQRRITIVGVPDVDAIAVDLPPSTRLWAHVFKIRGGAIHEIEAAGGIDLPLDATSGWRPANLGLEPTAQTAAAHGAR